MLGVSVDTVRRYADSGRLPMVRTRGGHRMVDGVDLARLADSVDGGRHRAEDSSARNHLTGIVTRVVRDNAAAQVELRCGPFRIVALLTREAVDALGLEPGVMAEAVIKATNVVVELASATSARAPDGDR